VREALGDRPVAPDVPRDYRMTLPAGVDVVERFAERVADYRAVVLRTTAAELPAAIAATLREIGAARVVVPDGVPAGWLAASTVDRVADDPPLTHAELDLVDAVLTGSTVAIAETGTIVLDGGPGQAGGRCRCCPTYVCVVDASAIVGGVPERCRGWCRRGR
jgi:L-lactate dehydrogenase complex protein LldG